MTFTSTIAKQKFFASADAAWARERLEEMIDDNRYNTLVMPLYVHALGEDVSFVDQHLRYLSEHPQLKVDEYLSNLRLKTRK